MLAQYWSPAHPEVFPSVTKLCEDCSAGRDFVQAGLRALEEAGMIRVVRAVGQSNRYRFYAPVGSTGNDESHHADSPATMNPTKQSDSRTLIRDLNNIPPLVPPTEPKPKRRCKLPKSWKPTQEHIQRATKTNVDVNSEAEKFRLHAEANDRLMVNWNAAFTTWLINAAEWRSKRVSSFSAGTPLGDPQNGVTEAARAQGRAIRERMLAAKARKRKLKR